jgi:hypothetical protein
VLNVNSNDAINAPTT